MWSCGSPRAPNSRPETPDRFAHTTQPNGADQRERLIGNLLDGATVGDDEDAIVDLLTSASDADARALINHFTWSRLHDEIDDLVGNAFADRFPKARYGR